MGFGLCCFYIFYIINFIILNTVSYSNQLRTLQSFQKRWFSLKFESEILIFVLSTNLIVLQRLAFGSFYYFQLLAIILLTFVFSCILALFIVLQCLDFSSCFANFSLHATCLTLTSTFQL